jgi:cytidylate kinase
MKWRNIVIAGDVGVGTTTLARGLSSKLDWIFLSAGEFFRKYSQEHNIPLWNKAAIPDDFERKIDSDLTSKIEKEKGWVIEGHYLGWFTKDLPDVFRILLTCDRAEANKRMLARKTSHVEGVEEIEKRRSGLYAKFKKLYSNENYEDPNLYQLTLDTTQTTPTETLEQAFKALG